MNKQILIAGSRGSIGSHLADDLLAAGEKGPLLDNLSPQVHGDSGGRSEVIGILERLPVRTSVSAKFRAVPSPEWTPASGGFNGRWPGRRWEEFVSSSLTMSMLGRSAAGSCSKAAGVWQAVPSALPVTHRRVHRCVALVVSLLSLAGCGLPRDSAGTLERLQGREIRAGFTANPPWTRIADPDAGPSGVEVHLLVELARLRGAQVPWCEDSEQDLFKALEAGELDIAIGGLTDESGYANRAGLSLPYTTIGEDKPVWAVRPGENGLLLEVDQFLQTRRSGILKNLLREPSL